MEADSHPILYFLETIYNKHADALAHHISEVTGGDYSLILSAIGSFKVNREVLDPSDPSDPADPPAPADPQAARGTKEPEKTAESLYKYM